MAEFLGITITEWFGYGASAGVLISFLMRNMKTLRIINTIGCGLFVIYGVLLTSAPIIITNATIILINLYYLLKRK